MAAGERYVIRGAEGMSVSIHPMRYDFHADVITWQVAELVPCVLPLSVVVSTIVAVKLATSLKPLNKLVLCDDERETETDRVPTDCAAKVAVALVELPFFIAIEYVAVALFTVMFMGIVTVEASA